MQAGDWKLTRSGRLKKSKLKKSEKISFGRFKYIGLHV